MDQAPAANGDKPRKRRAHSKSRNGCANCKLLRVKCDELRPSCRNCIKRKKPCEYPPVVVRPRRSSGSVDMTRRKSNVDSTPTITTASSTTLSTAPSTTSSGSAPNSCTSTTPSTSTTLSSIPYVSSSLSSSLSSSVPNLRRHSTASLMPALSESTSPPMLNSPNDLVPDPNFPILQHPPTPPLDSMAIPPAPMLVSDPMSSFCSSPSSSVTYKLDPGLTVVEGVTPDYPPATTTATVCGTNTNGITADNGMFNGSVDPQTLMLLDPARNYSCACPSLSSSELQAWTPTEADLMDHYKKACKELMSAYGPPGLTDERVWEEYIPSLVQSVPYLAHSFYAITAVHMMTMCKSRPGVEKYALEQFFRAMEEFEKLVAEPATSSTGEQEHSEAVFLATVFLMMLAFTFESAVPMFSRHPGEVDVLTLVRGPLIVARSMYPLLDDTSVVSSLRPGEFPTPDAGSQSPFGGPTVYDVLLNACSDMVLRGYLSQDHGNVCRKAIEDLKVSVRNSCAMLLPWVW
uniref:ARAD1C09944p n=1 Tax=Blastobotrys adeninivorans TaxID=409370 RepID=A0A060T583_BLAAD